MFFILLDFVCVYVCFVNIFLTFLEPKKDKTEQANGSISPSSDPPEGPALSSPGGDPSSAAGVGVSKPERPSSLGPGKLTRRLLCYHSEHCMSHSSPPRPNSLAAAASASGEFYNYCCLLLPDYTRTVICCV